MRRSATVWDRSSGEIREMTYEEMKTAVDSILNECDLEITKAEQVLNLVPSDGFIVGALHSRVIVAADEFEETRAK